MNYKIVILGNGGVGKTTYIKKLLTGEFEKKYVPTLGVDVFSLKLDTNCGDVTFNVWDCAGQEKYGGLRDGYYINSDGCILMFDYTSSQSLKSVLYWLSLFKRVVDRDVPVVLCGTKCDIKDKTVKTEDIYKILNNIRKLVPDVKYFEISSKTNYLNDSSNLTRLDSSKTNFNLNEPFLFLAKNLVKTENTQLVFTVSNVIEDNKDEKSGTRVEIVKEEENKNTEEEIKNEEKSWSYCSIV